MIPGEESMDPPAAGLIIGRRLARNTLWNLLGGLAPLLVGVVAIPVLVDKMGTPRFGVLTLAWMLVGYFSLFDLGLGRALTKLVAEKLGAGKESDVPALAWTSMALMALFGILGSLLLVSFTPWLVGRVLKVPSDLHTETVRAFYVLGATIPIVITATGLRGILAAYQRFDLINAIRIPLGMLTFLGPLAVVFFSNSLVPAVVSLGAVRLMAWVASLALCLRVVPDLRHRSRLRGQAVRTLLSYGGWMTVSNVVSPVMVSMDRFLIGATISMAAVAYYATPYEAITKLAIIPGALMGVVFPALSTALASSREQADRLYRRTLTYIFVALFPAVLAVVTLARPGLELWLGEEFARNSTVILQVLAVGVLINSLARLPFGLIQADGRPDLTAKLHLAELPVYLLTLWLFVHSFGIVGAAIAWTMRVTVDAGVLFVLARGSISRPAGRRGRSEVGAAVTLATLIAGAILPGLPAKALFLVVTGTLFLFTAWRWLLPPSDRAFVRAALHKRPRSL